MTEFPQYRKLEVPIATGISRFYKITDERHFVEASFQQGELQYHEIEAVQYPEMVRITDMLDESWSYVKMSPAEIAEVFPES